MPIDNNIETENKKEENGSSQGLNEGDVYIRDYNPMEVSEDVLREMIKAGLVYGRKKTKTHPKMKPLIFGNRNSVEIFDLTKTYGFLVRALDFLKEVVGRKGQILFVATQPEARMTVERIAKEFDQPHVVNRWLGGTLTNFSTLSQRIDYFKKLKSDLASGALEKYTKKERTDFNKEIGRLTTLFSGVENMPKLPQAIFVVNANLHMTAIREAKIMNIPVVAVMSTDTNPEIVEYPIPANDSAASSINWILAKMEATLSSTPKTPEAVPQQ